MTREAVTREIERLDAISRTRALDERESDHLGRLISTQRRYDGFRAKHPPVPATQPRPPRAPYRPRATIVERLDATIARMAREQLAVRAIYLTAADRDALAVIHPNADDYRGYPLRPTKSAAPASLIYSVHGIARCVRSAA